MIPYIFIHGIRQFGAKLGSASVHMVLEKIFKVNMHFNITIYVYDYYLPFEKGMALIHF